MMIADAIPRVGHKEYARFGFAVTILDRHHADGRGILERLAANGDLVMCDHRHLFGNRRRCRRRSGLASLRTGWRAGRLCGCGRLLTGRLLTLPLWTASLSLRALSG